MRTSPRARLRRTRWAVGLVTLSLVAAACGSSSSGSKGTSSGSKGIPKGPIKLGIIAALSGPNAAVGKLVTTQFKALIDEANKTGGIKGHQISLDVENSGGNPATAVTLARKFVDQGVVATLYNGSTAEGKDQVVAIEQKAGILGLAQESLNKYDSPTQYPYYFNTNPIDSQSTDAVATFAKGRGYDKIAQLGDGTPFAKSLEDNFSKSAKDKGLTIVKTTDYPTTATTMTTQLSELRQSGAKTLALWCEVGCGQVFDSLRQTGWHPTVLSGDLLSLLALSSVKNYGDTTFENCPISIAPGAKPTADVQQVVDLVAPKFGGISPSDFGFIEGSDAFRLLTYVIETADSTDGATLKHTLETAVTNKKFTNPDAKYTFSAKHHSGFQADTPNGVIPMCGLSKLGPLDLPLRVTS